MEAGRREKGRGRDSRNQRERGSGRERAVKKRKEKEGRRNKRDRLKDKSCLTQLCIMQGNNIMVYMRLTLKGASRTQVSFSVVAPHTVLTVQPSVLRIPVIAPVGSSTPSPPACQRYWRGVGGGGVKQLYRKLTD